MPGTSLRIRGRANRYGFAVSSYDLDGDAETGDLAPVYPATEDVAQKTLRSVHAQALEHRPRRRRRPLPRGVLASERLPLRADALAVVHRPRSLPEAEAGRTRLAFDELLILRLALLRRAASAKPLRSRSALRVSS